MCVISICDWCDWIWDMPLFTHNCKYLEIQILIIWIFVTLEGKQILAWNLPQFYDPTNHQVLTWYAAELPAILESLLLA